MSFRPCFCSFFTGPAFGAARFAALLFLVFQAAPDLCAQRQMEALGRGVVAMRTSSTQSYVGWRFLGTDASSTGFNLYRTVGSGAATKLNSSPITDTTNYSDTPGSSNFTQTIKYEVRPVINGVEQTAGAGSYTLPINAPTQQYISIPMQIPAGGTSPASADGTSAGGPYTYSPNDCSVGDLDGDGEYEIIVKWDPNNSKDNSQSGYTGNTYLDAYKLDGTRLWRIDLGPNIRSGAHYMDFMVYDFDGDGKAEIMCRTAPGAKDNSGNYVGGAAKWQTSGGARPTFNNTDDYRNTNGYILTGPEFLTVFGPDGVELASTNYIPLRGAVSSWGDSYGNRVDRFLAGVAYVDGQRPSGIFCRGYYTRAVISAWDWRGGQLTKRWTFDSDDGTAGNSAYRGQGAHSLSIGDLDGDGKDDISYGAAAIGSDGKGLWVTGLGHGDATHLSEMDPDHPGLKFFMPHEDPGSYGAYGTSYLDGRTGKVLWGVPGNGADVGRGVAMDIDPRYPGYEAWATNSSSVYTSAGAAITTASRPAVNFGIWWDDDLLRELLDGSTISKWSTLTNKTATLFTASGTSSNNSTKATPNLSADIFGDWREELILRTSDNSALRIYTTTIPTKNRMYTLMHDPQYRCAVAWQNTGYNQPPHPGFFLGYDMPAPPRAPIWVNGLTWKGSSANNVWDASTVNWLNGSAATAYKANDRVLFDLSGQNSVAVTLSGALTPGEMVVHNPQGKDYAFGGTGSLSGAMALTKAGTGSMTLSGTHPFTGATQVQQGTLVLNGTLANSAATIEGLGSVQGGGVFSQGLTLRKRAQLAPGNGVGSAGTLTVGNQLTLADSQLRFDLAGTPSGAKDLLAVNGNLNLSGTTGIDITLTNGQLAAGSYPLITYTGALSGALSNLKVTGLQGIPGSLALGSGVISLNVVSTRGAANAVWRGSGATWDLVTTPNWVVSGSNDTFVTGDAVLFDGTGAAAPTVNLADAMYPGSVSVNAASNYVFAGSGSIAGSGGLTKSGAGKLTIQTTNSYTGPTILNAGTIEVTTLADGGSPSQIGAASDVAGNLVFNGGTLRFTAGQTATDHDATLNAGGGTFDVSSSSGNLVLTGNLSGSGVLTKIGSGILTFSGTNTYSGGTVINAGTVQLGSSNANVNGLGSGLVTLSGGTLSMTDVQANNVCNWNLNVPSGSAGRLNCDGRCSLNGSLIGGGVFTYYVGYVRTDQKGDWSKFTGQINAVSDSDGGDFRATNANGYIGATLNLGDQVFAYYNSTMSSDLTLDIGALSGVSTASLQGGPTGGRTLTWRIGAKNVNSTYDGLIANGTGLTALTKIGAGMLTLTGDCTYTGATSVQGGALFVDGSLTGSAVTVQSGGTLSGAGTITGNVAINAGGTLAVSSSTFAVVGNVTNNGTARFIGGLAPKVSGVFTNNGVLDIMTGAQTLPANFVNNGVVLDSSAVKVANAGLTAAGAQITIQGYVGHSYQLQKRASLVTGAWANVGAAANGAGAALTLSDASASGSASAFYRVVVSP